jgi:signal transduction histidine kinase
LVFSTSEPLTYLVFASLIWTAFRLGPRGATLAVLVASAFAVWATTHYRGPFASSPLSRDVLETQLFIVVASLSSQLLAAVVTDRERFARGLWTSRARLVRAGDTERRRLERNLHDGAQQRLAGVMVRLDLADEAATEAPVRAHEALKTARAELAVAIDELRELAHGKRPAVLTEEGLGAAIVDIANRSPIHTVVRGLPARPLPDAAEETAYYVIAETVTNAQKHARASTITLSADVNGGVLHVEIHDDGIGGAVESAGSGLEGLRDRVDALGGTLDVESVIGRGTRITARIPETAGTR